MFSVVDSVDVPLHAATGGSLAETNRTAPLKSRNAATSISFLARSRCLVGSSGTIKVWRLEKQASYGSARFGAA